MADLPRRKLGKTGVEITILNQGTGGKSESMDRILRQSYANGVRTFDTAKVYGSEPNFKKWFAEAPEVRESIFLVTKDTPKVPGQLVGMLDERLEALGVDHVDLFFVHGMGDEHPLDEALKFVKGQEFKETAEKIRKSGKAKFLGFSTHHKDRAAIIQAAAEGGIVDAIMLQYTPWLDKDAPLNRALDACHDKGIGLITMKQVAGKFPPNQPAKNILDEVTRRVPMLKERNLSPYQGLLHAIWTDERISSSCVSMRNTDQIRQNADAARRFEPVKEADIHRLRDAVAALNPTLCADCDGRCSARRRNDRRAWQPDAVPDLPRAPRPPLRGPPPVRRPGPRRPRLGRRRPRRRPRGLPLQARLRQAPSRSRKAPRLSRRRNFPQGGFQPAIFAPVVGTWMEG